eukprot:COSAG02_NODE_1382_length_12967_cov_9.151694_4_plen_151_part_00
MDWFVWVLVSSHRQRCAQTKLVPCANAIVVRNDRLANSARCDQRTEGVHPDEIGKQRVGIFGNVRMIGPSRTYHILVNCMELILYRVIPAWSPRSASSAVARVSQVVDSRSRKSSRLQKVYAACLHHPVEKRSLIRTGDGSWRRSTHMHQ